MTEQIPTERKSDGAKTNGWSERVTERKSDGAKSDGVMERQKNGATEQQIDRATEQIATER